MSALIEAAHTTEKLIEARDTLRKLWGDRYEAKIAEARDLLRETAAVAGIGVLECATRMAAVCENDWHRWQFLAAAVDLIDADCKSRHA